MKQNYKILIVGRSGVGKDYLANLLKEKGMTQVLSYTTRPKRSTDENTHIFITPEEAATFTDKVATTVINGYEYFATRKQVEENDIYIIDPNGLHELMDNMPDTPFLIIYLKSGTEQAKEKAAGRSADPEKEKAVFDARRESEDDQFTKFEAELKGDVVGHSYFFIRVENTYQPDVFDELVTQIENMRRVFVTTLGLVRKAKEKDILHTEGDRIRVFYDNGRKDLSEERFAMEVMNSPEGLGRIVRALLFDVVPELLTQPNGPVIATSSQEPSEKRGEEEIRRLLAERLYGALDTYVQYTGLRYDEETEEYLSDVSLGMDEECMAAIENAHADLGHYLGIS